MYESEFEFQECPQEPVPPYTLIPNALIRDDSITPECRWLLIYLLSNAPGWKIKSSQIINHLKGFRGYGRESVLNILKEARNAGYIYRKEETVNNLKRYTYLISKTARFKKSFLQSEFPTPEISTPEKSTTKELTSLKKEHLKETTTTPTSKLVEPTPLKSANDVDVLLKNSLIKGLKGDKAKAKRAYDYFKANEEYVRNKATSSIEGYLIDLVRNDRDLIPIPIPIGKTNRDFAQAVVNLYGDAKQNEPIEIYQEGIAFAMINGSFTLKFTDHGFKEQVINRLRKMGLDVTPFL